MPYEQEAVARLKAGGYNDEARRLQELNFSSVDPKEALLSYNARTIASIINKV